MKKFVTSRRDVRVEMNATTLFLEAEFGHISQRCESRNGC